MYSKSGYQTAETCLSAEDVAGLPLAPRLFSFPFFSTAPSLFLSIIPGKLRGNREFWGL